MLAFPQRLAYTGALVLLVDSTSQSAAEIFAASLQESGRALVVGEISAGNVIPSAIIKLPTGALLQYGFAKYRTPQGTLLEARGWIPDLIVNRTRASLLLDGDPQLTAGLKKLSERITAARRPPIAGRVTARAPLYGDPKKTSVDGDPKRNGCDGLRCSPPPPPKPPPVRQPTENAAAGESSPSPKQLIEKYLDAVGGEKALLSLTSRVSIGTVEISAMGLTGKAELYEQSPNKSALVMSIEGLGVIRQTSVGNARLVSRSAGRLCSRAAGRFRGN